jgi:hypothetical protein
MFPSSFPKPHITCVRRMREVNKAMHIGRITCARVHGFVESTSVFTTAFARASLGTGNDDLLGNRQLETENGPYKLRSLTILSLVLSSCFIQPVMTSIILSSSTSASQNLLLEQFVKLSCHASVTHAAAEEFRFLTGRRHRHPLGT